jgi:SAM-dependent methyltransferase
MLRRIHSAHVHTRRVRVLASHLCDMIPHGARVLDVGAGDGLLASQVLAKRTDLQWVAIDTLARPVTHVPMQLFDGEHLPFGDKEFDQVIFIDVLHHADDPMSLLREAVRVTRNGILIKDHLREGIFAGPTLRFMDWVGNSAWGVSLPYNYWNRAQWQAAQRELRLETEENRVSLGLYPWWANWWFGRSLHFIARFRALSNLVHPAHVLSS